MMERWQWVGAKEMGWDDELELWGPGDGLDGARAVAQGDEDVAMDLGAMGLE